jgi:hypothetical protein
MISCKKASLLISKRMDEPLSFLEKILLISHLTICWCCQRFDNQILALRKAFRNMAQESIAFERYAELGLPGLSSETKDKIIKSIRKFDELN